MNIYIYIYIYIERERERERKLDAIPQHNAETNDDDELTCHWVKNIKNHYLSSSQFT